MKVTMKIIGIEHLQKELAKRQDLTPFKDVLKANAIRLQRGAMRDAPIDTGMLRRSIMLEFENGGMTAYVNANTEYAAYVEYGTRYMSAQPFMYPNFVKAKTQLTSDLWRLIKE